MLVIAIALGVALGLILYDGFCVLLDYLQGY